MTTTDVPRKDGNRRIIMKTIARSQVQPYRGGGPVTSGARVVGAPASNCVRFLRGASGTHGDG